jgi:hypothetical protein
MFVLVALFALTSVVSADDIQRHYAQQDIPALKAMHRPVLPSELDLQLRYRLFPLTNEASYLENLPEPGPRTSARELALLAGLWGYRASNTSIANAVRHGTRSARFLRTAREIDPDDPWVLFVEGQSLLFMPRIAGGDPAKALKRFRLLRQASLAGTGISPIEVDVWVWYALHRLGRSEAASLRSGLLAGNPPPLFRNFLLDPP